MWGKPGVNGSKHKWKKTTQRPLQTMQGRVGNDKIVMCSQWNDSCADVLTDFKYDGD